MAKKNGILTEKRLEKYQDHYSEEKLWSKMKRFAARLGGKATYYVLVLYYVLQSPDVPMSNKTMILGAMGYFILPLDLIPALGFTDDIAALTLAYKAIQSSITPEIKALAEAKVKEWL